MKQNIFTIYDSKAHAYLTPFFLHQDGMALRIFTDCVNDPNHQFGKHPEDYTLFSIGSWSDDKAKFLTNNPVAIATGIELKKEPIVKTMFEELSEEEKAELIEDWDKDHNPLKEVK